MAKKGTPEAPGRDELKRLRKLIKTTRIAMLTTVAQDGSLRSRPMATLKARFDGDVWFITRAGAPKADEIKDNQHVNLSYASPDDDRFVSISGSASLVRDAERVAAMWSRRLRDWFPEGKRDPELVLIRVKVEHAEFWDPKTSTMVHVGDVARALAEENAASPAAAPPAAPPAPNPTGKVSAGA